MSRSQRKDKSRRGRPEPSNLGRKPPADKQARRGMLTPAAIRETVESIVIALVAAFLLRTFVVEAFVIPTGSMAPTLLGRHKDVTCPKCGYLYCVNASQEMDELERPTGYRVISGTCPMCRFTTDLSPDNVLGQSYPSYSGDRILAGKADYALGSPDRWDVVVFKFPLNASVNYIKRLAGLPNETLRIQYGDVWVKASATADFTPARRPPEKILAMLQPVYDNDYSLPDLVRQGWPARWVSMPAAGGWKASDALKSFQVDGTAPGEVWLDYRHAVPSYEDWANQAGALPMRPSAPKPQLISDFTPYDTDRVEPGGALGPPPRIPLPDGLGWQPGPPALGLNWVGDLALEFDVNATGGSGQLLLDLVKGGHHFLCQLDLEQGTAELTIPGVAALRPMSTGGIRAPGKHSVRLGNIDQQLLLWLDGRLVTFDAPTTYESQKIDVTVPNQDDLLPVRIGSRGAALELTHLKVFRDIYYIAVQAREEDEPPRFMSDFEPADPDFPYVNLSPSRVAQFLSDAGEWSVFGRRRSVEFQLGEHEFFMLGDNSAESKDGRLWGRSQFYVKEDLLVGKALMVYWPHSLHRITGTRIPFPFFPNFSRMGRIE